MSTADNQKTQPVPDELPEWEGDGARGDTLEGILTAKRPPKRSPLPWLVTVFFLLGGAAVAWWMLHDQGRNFPEVAPGHYIGKLIGIFPEDGDGPTYFYVQRDPGSDELVVALLKPGWHPARVSSVISHGISEKRWALPLLISGPRERLQLYGAQSGNHRYQGVVSLVDSGKEGVWYLESVNSVTLNAEAAAGVRLWLSLVSELSETDSRIAAYSERVPKQKAEITRLTSLLTEGEQLRSKANEKFSVTQRDLKELHAEKARHEAEIAKLAQSFQVSLKVTQFGRLASLARDSLQREWSIIESLLKSDVTEESPELQAAVKRAEQIRGLQDEVHRERERIQELLEHQLAALRREEPVKLSRR